MPQLPFNPLDRARLADSISRALLEQPLLALPEPKKKTGRFLGAGVYAIYYLGDFPQYEAIAGTPDEVSAASPLYVGKAIPKGGRIGGLTDLSAVSDAMFVRLREHASSIDSAINLELADFRCRWLVTDDVFIPLGENRLIDLFRPVWNVRLSGFGNHDPGGRRQAQYRSPWDTVHPGRRWATKLADYPESADQIWERLALGQSVIAEYDEEAPLAEAVRGEPRTQP